MLQVFLVTAIVIYIIQSIWRWRRSIKWCDNIPGRWDTYFYTLIIKMGLASPTREYWGTYVRGFPAKGTSRAGLRGTEGSQRGNIYEFLCFFVPFLWTPLNLAIITTSNFLVIHIFFKHSTGLSGMAIDNSRMYPRLHCYLFMSKVYIHVNHPDLIKQVLTSQHCLKKTEDYKFAKWNNGIGVLLRTYLITFPFL